MNRAVIFLLSLAAAAPPPAQKAKDVIKHDEFRDVDVIYTSSHDIVDIAVPAISPCLNGDLDRQIDRHFIFFVEADLKDNGAKDYKGVYILKDNQARKLLDNGQSVTHALDVAYFGAKDGLYEYNMERNSAEKVGNITDSIIQIDIDMRHGGVYYYLTEDYVLYKFNEHVKTSTKVEAVMDARDMIVDFYGNVYFIDGTKQVYVYDGENVVKIKGLPYDFKKIVFFQSSRIEALVYANIDGVLYFLKKNGTSVETVVYFEAQPTAYALEDAAYMCYAYNKKIYKGSQFSYL